MGVDIMAEKTKKEAKFRHGMLAFGLLAAVMFGCVVGLGTDPQIPMLIGCVISGFIALYLGFDWEEILDAMKKGHRRFDGSVPDSYLHWRYGRGLDSVGHGAHDDLLRA